MSKLASARAVLHAFEITAETMSLKSSKILCSDWSSGIVYRVLTTTPPPPPLPGRWRPKRNFYSIALTLCSLLHSYTKSAVSFEMYIQQIKSLLFHIRFWNFLTSPVSYAIPSWCTPTSPPPHPLRKILDPPLWPSAWSLTCLCETTG